MRKKSEQAGQQDVSARRTAAFQKPKKDRENFRQALINILMWVSIRGYQLIN
jgi:hypothetical protein